MEICKKRSAKTFTTKDGKVLYYTNYYVRLDSGLLIQINCRFNDDYAYLKAVAKDLD